MALRNRELHARNDDDAVSCEIIGLLSNNICLLCIKRIRERWQPVSFAEAEPGQRSG